MKLVEFLRMFSDLGSNIDTVVVWQNGKHIASQSIGDTRYYTQSQRESTVWRFTVPKRTHALYVILEPTEDNRK